MIVIKADSKVRRCNESWYTIDLVKNKIYQTGDEFLQLLAGKTIKLKLIRITRKCKIDEVIPLNGNTVILKVTEISLCVYG